MANRMTPPTEGQEKDVLLVLDKQQGKVSAVKSFDKDGNLQTVSPTHGGEFMQVDKNSDVFSNFISNFFRKFQDTSGLELFSVKASEAEQQARAIEDNHRNPTPEGSKRTEMLRVPKSDFHEFKQGYRFDPAKIDWENLKKVGITADPKSGEQIPVFVSRDRYTHELEYMRADKWKCPDTICNVKVSPEQKAAFEAGQAVKMENLQFRDGTKRSAYLQVSAVERGLEFLPRAAVQFLQQGQQQVAGLKDGQGVEFNGHVQSGAQGKSPDKVQPKDVTPAAESRTQVAVNTEGKTNEATKQGKEPLKQGQQKPTAKQKEKQDKAQDKSLKADKPKKSKGMKM